MLKLWSEYDPPPNLCNSYIPTELEIVLIQFVIPSVSVLLTLAVCASYHFCADKQFHDIFTLLLN